MAHIINKIDIKPRASKIKKYLSCDKNRVINSNCIKEKFESAAKIKNQPEADVFQRNAKVEESAKANKFSK